MIGERSIFQISFIRDEYLIKKFIHHIDWINVVENMSINISSGVLRTVCYASKIPEVFRGTVIFIFDSRR